MSDLDNLSDIVTHEHARQALRNRSRAVAAPALDEEKLGINWPAVCVYGGTMLFWAVASCLIIFVV